MKLKKLTYKTIHLHFLINNVSNQQDAALSVITIYNKLRFTKNKVSELYFKKTPRTLIFLRKLIFVKKTKLKNFLKDFDKNSLLNKQYQKQFKTLKVLTELLNSSYKTKQKFLLVYFNLLSLIAKYELNKYHLDNRGLNLKKCIKFTFILHLYVLNLSFHFLKSENSIYQLCNLAN